ncbi:MAG: hypothetical protein C0524_04725 [Rhodobacter sp.]|nr:hypothetical protein [Rhodobacter sp.]
MTTAAHQPAPTIAAELVKKAGRRVFQTGVILLCVWTLLPIYLPVTNALSTPEEVNGFPKAFFPSFDLASIRFFIEFDGVLHALWTSIKVAVVTMMSCCRFRGREDKIVTMELEDANDTTEVQPRVQDRGGKAGGGAGRCGCRPRNAASRWCFRTMPYSRI